MMTLDKKIDLAIKIIKAAATKAKENGGVIEVAYSGGKDSDVILELTKMAGVPYRAIYKNTTVDPPLTVKHAKEMGAEIHMPERTFFEIVASHGLPNRHKRTCCGYLKEYKILDYVILGIRREESKARAERYKEPELCRKFPHGQKARHYMPILEWTAQDVADFVKMRGIQCHPLYYDEQGFFHPERRLGCMCCPLQYEKSRIAQFKQHPNMVKAYIRAAQKFFDTHPDSKMRDMYDDVYEWFVSDVFYSHDDRYRKKWDEINSGLFKPDYKAFLEREFNIKFN